MRLVACLTLYFCTLCNCSCFWVPVVRNFCPLRLSTTSCSTAFPFGFFYFSFPSLFLTFSASLSFIPPLPLRLMPLFPHSLLSVTLVPHYASWREGGRGGRRGASPPRLTGAVGDRPGLRVCPLSSIYWLVN